MEHLNQVVQLAKAVAAKLDTFNGNCGPFAAAMYQHCSANGIPTGLIYVENDEEDGVGHAAIVVEGHIVDGSGVISLDTLKEYGLYDHGSTPDEVNVTEYAPEVVTDGELWYIVRYTDGELDVAHFLSAISDVMAQLPQAQTK